MKIVDSTLFLKDLQSSSLASFAFNLTRSERRNTILLLHHDGFGRREGPWHRDGIIQRQENRPMRRKSRPRPEGRAAQTQGQQHRDIVSGPAVPAAASGNIRSICRASQRARSGVGAGRAAQHGPVLLCDAAANTASARARTGVAFGQAVLERQPRNGFGESARTRTENSGVAGLHHQLRQLIHPTTTWNLKNPFYRIRSSESWAVDRIRVPVDWRCL